MQKQEVEVEISRIVASVVRSTGLNPALPNLHHAPRPYRGVKGCEIDSKSACSDVEIRCCMHCCRKNRARVSKLNPSYPPLIHVE
jgi:hypothetical protein